MTHVSLPEASRLCGRSQSWVRKKARELEKEGRATKTKAGTWEIERAAILGLAGEATHEERKGATSKASSEAFERTELVAILKDQNGHLKSLLSGHTERIRELEVENRQLRQELRAVIEGKTQGRLSRFLGDIRAAKDEISELFKGK